jgi:hypothetical protein
VRDHQPSLHRHPHDELARPFVSALLRVSNSFILSDFPSSFSDLTPLFSFHYLAFRMLLHTHRFFCLPMRSLRSRSFFSQGFSDPSSPGAASMIGGSASLSLTFLLSDFD